MFLNTDRILRYRIFTPIKSGCREIFFTRTAYSFDPVGLYRDRTFTFYWLQNTIKEMQQYVTTDISRN